MLNFYDDLTARLNAIGDWFAPLFLRVILWWEFWEAGVSKYNGDNWFGGIEDQFPAPFSSLSAEMNWLFATWGELVFSLMLLFGLFTRFAAFSLLIITAVAIASVHWPESFGTLGELWAQGYDISDGDGGNYKLPLIFMVMLMPLILRGGGSLSLDRALVALTTRSDRIHERTGGLGSLGLGLLIIGAAVVLVVPMWGYVVLALAVVAMLAEKFVDRP